MEDITTERPKLKMMLDQTNSSIDKWIGEVKFNLGVTQEQGRAAEDQMSDLEERTGQLQAMRKELKALSSSMDEQLHQKELAIQDREQTRSLLKKEQDLLVDQDKTVDSKLKELTRGVEMFRDRLGLTFKKSRGNRLQMVFTNISYKDPKLPFYFSCQVEGEKYIISDCEPAIPDLNVLVDKLNSTNNMRSFVVAMRKRFKKIAENQ